MTRWLVFLNAYSYRLMHHPGKELGNADALSRCLLPAQVDDPAMIPFILRQMTS